jgi:cobalt-zinc-cadmium efflux system protein
MQEHEPALDAHVVLTRDATEQTEVVKAAIKRVLAERFDIHHSTLEFEQPDHAHQGASRLGRDTARGHSHGHGT